MATNGENGNGLKQILLNGLTVLISVLVVLGGAWAVLVRPLDTKYDMLEKGFEQNRSYVREVETRLLKEIEELKDANAATRERSETNRSAIVSINESLREVETQFGSVSQLRNVQQENVARFISLLWRRTYGEELPVDGFFPHVGNGNKK